jgi:hypothetical protein
LGVPEDFFHPGIVKQQVPQLQTPVGRVGWVIAGLSLFQQVSLPIHAFRHSQEFEQQRCEWLSLQPVAPDCLCDPRLIAVFGAEIGLCIGERDHCSTK